MAEELVHNVEFYALDTAGQCGRRAVRAALGGASLLSDSFALMMLVLGGTGKALDKGFWGR